MNDRKRLRRDDPPRVAPVRNFSNLYGGSARVNGANPGKPVPSDAARKKSMGGPLAEGVELAYSVIEKYIAEGRQIAQGFSNQPYATRATNDNLQDILERVLRFQAEIMPLWIETLATLVKVDPSRNGHATPETRPRPNGGQSAQTMTTSIEVVSIRPTKVSIELRPDSDARSLVALGLYAVDSRKPALTEISLSPDEVQGRVILHIRVPDKQPPGTYSGVIVNRESGETRGTLTVRVAD